MQGYNALERGDGWALFPKNNDQFIFTVEKTDDGKHLYLTEIGLNLSGLDVNYDQPKDFMEMTQPSTPSQHQPDKTPQTVDNPPIGGPPVPNVIPDPNQQHSFPWQSPPRFGRPPSGKFLPSTTPGREQQMNEDKGDAVAARPEEIPPEDIAKLKEALSHKEPAGQ